jgi:hypothetical protein
MIPTGQVDFFFMGMLGFQVAGPANIGDYLAFDKDGTVDVDRSGGVYSHDGGVRNEHFG